MAYHTISPSDDIESVLQSNFQSITNAFNHQKEQYISIIQSQQHKIDALTQEIENLRLEKQNILYQLETLKQKLQTISNTNHEEEYSILYKVPQKENNITYEPIPIKNYSNVINKQISNSNSFLTNRTNKSCLSIQTDRDNNHSTHNKHQRNSRSKHDSIQQRINSLRSYNTQSNSQSKSKLFNNSTSFDDEYFNNENNNYKGNTTSHRNTILIEDSPQYEHEHKSQQYQKTNNFIKQCKLALNASNFEKLLQVFKENKGYGEESTREMKLKAKDILKGNTKLQMMFDDIYS